MRAGANRILLELESDDKNRKIKVGGAEIEIRALLQDQWQFITVVGNIVDIGARFYDGSKTGFRFLPGDYAIINYMAVANESNEVFLAEDGTRIVSITFPFIVGCIRGTDLISVGQNIFSRLVYDESKHKVGSIFIEEPDTRKIKSKIIAVDELYEHNLSIRCGDEVIHYDDSALPLIIDGQEFQQIRFRDILAIERDDALIAVDDSVVLDRDGWPDRVGSIYIPKEVQARKDTAVVVSAGSRVKEVRVGDGCCFNRGELTMPYKIKGGKQFWLTKKQHLFLRYGR